MHKNRTVFHCTHITASSDNGTCYVDELRKWCPISFTIHIKINCKTYHLMRFVLDLLIMYQYFITSDVTKYEIL